jgi:hypothetical protein
MSSCDSRRDAGVPITALNSLAFQKINPIQQACKLMINFLASS